MTSEGMLDFWVCPDNRRDNIPDSARHERVAKDIGWQYARRLRQINLEPRLQHAGRDANTETMTGRKVKDGLLGKPLNLRYLATGLVRDDCSHGVTLAAQRKNSAVARP
jgi:hypothetical protein